MRRRANPRAEKLVRGMYPRVRIQRENGSYYVRIPPDFSDDGDGDGCLLGSSSFSEAWAWHNAASRLGLLK